MKANPESSVPVLIGLAGTSCSGKNTAAFFLQERGFYVIDADVVSRKVFQSIQHQLIEAFQQEAGSLGVNLTHKDGSINKKTFAGFVFSNPVRLKKHEELIFPYIIEEIDKEINKAFTENPRSPIVLNAPTLHKTPFLTKCEFILYIDAPEIIRFFRARKRDKLSFKEIAVRFSRQKDFFSQYFFSGADTVKVINIGCTAKLKKNLERELKKRGF